MDKTRVFFNLDIRKDGQEIAKEYLNQNEETENTPTLKIKK